MINTPGGRNLKVVEELKFGVYVWRMPNGQWVGDEDGNWLCISAQKGDIKRISQLTDAARAHGIEEGTPYFLAGHRRVDDEEYERQSQRLRMGLVPDDHDIPALMEDLEHRRANKNR